MSLNTSFILSSAAWCRCQCSRAHACLLALVQPGVLGLALRGLVPFLAVFGSKTGKVNVAEVEAVGVVELGGV